MTALFLLFALPKYHTPIPVLFLFLLLISIHIHTHTPTPAPPPATTGDDPPVLGNAVLPAPEGRT